MQPRRLFRGQQRFTRQLCGVMWTLAPALMLDTWRTLPGPMSVSCQSGRRPTGGAGIGAVRRGSRLSGKRAGAGLVISGAKAAVYFRLLRPWHLHWGATAQEAGGEVAGDELMPDPDVVATRVVEIDAPPSAIWPWLVQMWPGRGGAYTYDWIERRLGIDIRNTDRVIPELQHLKVGDDGTEER